MMGWEDIAYLIALGGVAFLLSYFYYFKRRFVKWRHRLLLTLLRAMAFWCLSLLLVNPQIKRNTAIVQKPKLVVLVDDSQSIKHLKRDDKVRVIVDSLSESEALDDKYNLKFYAFSKDVKRLDSLRFDGRSSAIYEAVRALKIIDKEDSVETSVLMITDGNQTIGRDYEYLRNVSYPIHTMCVGDTLKSVDTKINQVNTNKYASMEVRSPVEIFVSCEDLKTDVDTDLRILEKDNVVFKTEIAFSPSENFATVGAYIIPKTKGRHIYRVELNPLGGEKNTQNNSRVFAVEVIDQKTKVLIVSDISHPDIGALKRALQHDQKWQVVVATSKVAKDNIKDQDAVILYQPEDGFSAVFETLEHYGKNYFVIAGLRTDWNFLNGVQSAVHTDITPNIDTDEDVGAVPNFSYPNFALEDIGFSDFPSVKRPLLSLKFGMPVQTLLYKSIESIETKDPLLISLEQGKRRFVYCFAEGFWKWRMHSFVNSKSFDAFDNFMGRLVSYIGSQNNKQRLIPDYEISYYQGSESSVFKASYFDKNFELDMSAQLLLQLKDDKNQHREIPMIARQNYYEVDLSSFPQGHYNFNLKEPGTNVQVSGDFDIIAFNQEIRSDVANIRKLRILSENTNGTMFNSTGAAIKNFISKPTSSVKKIITGEVSLIEWYYLLIIAIILFASEWFTRKYLGLI